MIKDYTEDAHLADIKLIAVDMDLTLLADDGSQPDGMADRIAALAEADVVFCPASGRPGPTLQMAFPEHAASMAFCPDNGGEIIYKGESVFRSLMDSEIYRAILCHAEDEEGAVPVLCCFDKAYVLERDREHTEALYKYYKDIRFIDTFKGIDVESDKCSIYFPAWNAEPRFREVYNPLFGEQAFITNAGREWIDCMNTGVNKGSGIAHLCERLGIDIADAAAVGDTYNDIPLLEAAGHSFIVANAEKHMEAHATYRVPSNNDRGVVALIDALLAAQTHRRAQNHQ